ncbi:MAG: hypothetical protein ACI4WG_00005, partial [Erysipelotrichaceae bacterium]
YNQDLNETIEREDVKFTNPEGVWSNEADNVHYYVCNSCGGEIITDDTTVATKCPYCDSSIVLNSQLSGQLKPDLIIPFKLDKKQAQEQYLSHLKGKPLVPKMFKQLNHVDEIKAIYVPCWLYDASISASATFNCEKVRHYSDSEYDYTETEYYNVYRKASMSFNDIPVDGSTKIDSVLIESIEPFDMSQSQQFTTAYLAGYMAEKYNVDEQQSSARANERLHNSAISELRSSVIGYSSVTLANSHIALLDGKVKYALLPVWFLITTYKNKQYIFAMNGQTGKFVGDLPVDSSILLKKFLIMFVIVTVIAAIIMLFV